MNDAPLFDYRDNPGPSVDTFRAWFPEFSDINRYSDFQIEFYLTWAIDLMGDRMTQPPNYDGTGSVWRWGRQFDRYVALLAAHCITLATQADLTAQAGGVPGTQTGVVDRKSVGPIHLGYNSTIGIVKNAGWFASTKYGNQWFEQMLLVGTGGLVI